MRTGSRLVGEQRRQLVSAYSNASQDPHNMDDVHLRRAELQAFQRASWWAGRYRTLVMERELRKEKQ